MSVLGCGIDSPFRAGSGTVLVGRPRPPVDAEAMRRLREPFAPPPTVVRPDAWPVEAGGCGEGGV